ncbi:MAG TPA: helix-turn-helix domain-containing protein [Pedobacter sp.]|nr:helix-turn-helix domain-containing protein [Pedobacter sp.]
MATIDLITKDDLQNFKSELLTELKLILESRSASSQKWLKSAEVRKMLNISPGTLQNLRINGTIKYTKVGSIIYYSQGDIQSLLENGLR